jgi:glycosyltransferase involved in cell wall biosynthesis
MPLVSVIIPTFNRRSVLERAICSVLAQTFRDFELIVVDDGSTDGTTGLLEDFDSRLMRLYQENRGVASSRNLGIKQSRGELVAFLDSDDEWLPEKLSRQVERFDPSRPYFVCHTDEIWMRGEQVVSQKSIHRKQGGRFFERALERCLISPSSVMLSRTLLDKVGWFDEALPAAEDYDLWLRVTASYDVDFVPERLVIKHGGRHDQLSLKIPAIDRFRVQAIGKMLEGSELSPAYREAAVRELVKKCGIVASGCRKRGNDQEAQYYLELADKFQSGCSGCS